MNTRRGEGSVHFNERHSICRSINGTVNSWLLIVQASLFGWKELWIKITLL